MSDNKKYFFDNPRNIQMVLYALFGSCAVLFIMDFVFHRHKLHPWEGLLGFYAVYGFCRVCRSGTGGEVDAKRFLMRDEEYYDRDETGSA